jgi:two-component system response regulator HydG
MQSLEILVADDNQDLADGLGMILEDEGHRVSVVYRGESAIERARDTSFDAILLDFKFPGIHGMEVLRSIHKQDSRPHIFLMTGFRVEQLLEELFVGRPCSILRPPFVASELLMALQKPKAFVLAVDSAVNSPPLEALLVEADVQVERLSRASDFDPEKSAADVLLLDVEAPMTRGLEVFFDLREIGVSTPALLKLAPALPGSQDDLLRCSRSTGCFFKPFDLEDAIRTIEAQCLQPSSL